MQTYKSRKDENVKAKIETTEEKYGTVIMVYVSGPDEGKTFSITKSTLKRWWEPCEDVDTRTEFEKSLDFEKINTTYPEPKVQKRIKTPKAVIEYEAKKRNGKYITDLPTFEQIVEQIQAKAKRINDKTKYLTLWDKSTVWRKAVSINIYATESLWSALTERGLVSKQNKDKDRPFEFYIKTLEDWNKVLEVLSDV